MNFLSKFFMNMPLFLYRLTNGKVGGKMGNRKVLILTTKGRRSGKIHSTPLNYFEHNDGYLIAASNAGRVNNPSWFYNIQANPDDVTIQVMDKKMRVKPQILIGEPRQQLYKWIVSVAPIFGEYEKKLSREIPLVLLKKK